MWTCINPNMDSLECKCLTWMVAFQCVVVFNCDSLTQLTLGSCESIWTHTLKRIPVRNCSTHPAVLTWVWIAQALLADTVENSWGEKEKVVRIWLLYLSLHQTDGPHGDVPLSHCFFETADKSKGPLKNCHGSKKDVDYIIRAAILEGDP